MTCIKHEIDVNQIDKIEIFIKEKKEICEYLNSKVFIGNSINELVFKNFSPNDLNILDKIFPRETFEILQIIYLDENNRKLLTISFKNFRFPDTEIVVDCIKAQLKEEYKIHLLECVSNKVECLECGRPSCSKSSEIKNRLQ